MFSFIIKISIFLIVAALYWLLLNTGAVFVATAVLQLGSEAVKEAVAAVLEAFNLFKNLYFQD